MVGDTGQHVGEPGAGIDVVQLGGGDERIHRRGAFAAAIAAGEHPCLSAKRHAAQLPLGCVVRQADPAVSQEAAEGVPAGQHVVHRLGHLGMTGHPGALLAHPGLEFGDEGCDLLLPQGQALLGRQALDGALGRKDRVDPPHRLGGQRGTGDLGKLEQLAPAMRPAGGLGDRAGLAAWRVEFVEPGIGIGLQDALVAGQVALRMLAGTVTRVAERRRRRCWSGKGPVVAHIGPDPADDGAAAGQHRHRGVVAVQPRGGEDMGVDQRHHRRQASGAGADPVGNGGDAEFDALAGVGFAEAVQRQVLAELCLEDHRQ